MTRYAKMRISNPSHFFGTPDQVLNDGKLSRDDRENVLKSMALDAEQLIDAPSEGMVGNSSADNARDLQSALIQLEISRKPKTVQATSLKNARFQRIMVVTTVNQDLNREIADIAFDMAGIVGGKVYLLSVVPLVIEGAGLMAAGPMVTVVHPVAPDNTQIIEDRNEQLAELVFESGSNVETKIDVRSGQIEQVIADYADDCNADVIVVGSPNRSWIEALFDPSIVSRVTHSAPCPVLIVPETA